MKKIAFVPILGIIAGLFKMYKRLTARYRFGFYYIDKNDDQLQDDQMDLRGVPTHLCICGSPLFYVKATFYNNEIASYMLDMECATCGSLATAPTPLDMENME